MNKKWTKVNNIKRKFLALCFLYATIFMLSAQVSLDKPDLSQPTFIAPFYFNPNAFPIPDMLDGTVSDKLHISLAGEYYKGFKADQTIDLFARVLIPLFTDRINLGIWMPIVQTYKNTTKRQVEQRLNDSIPLSGIAFGDVYVSIDIHVLKQRKYRPDLTIRSALKTASGGGFEKAVHYDNPGYFFDLSLAKSIYFKSRFWKEIRLVGSAGFMCWQTDNGRQNDATMYGAQLKLKTRYFTISESFGGYSGWERNGDLPMSIKTQVTLHFGKIEPFVLYQYGLRDYPYHHFRAGIAYQIDILKKQRFLSIFKAHNK